MKIKYDRSTNKTLLITTIVSGLLVMVGLYGKKLMEYWEKDMVCY